MRTRKLLAYFAIYIVWGGSFLGIREVVAVAPPFFAAAFRFLCAGSLLLLFARFFGPGPKESHRMTQRQWLNAALLGLIMFTGDYACLFSAEQRISSGIASVISATIPVWIFAGEVFLLRTQRVTVISLLGIALGFAGVVVLTCQAMRSGPFGSSSALLVALFGVFCWAGGTLLSRKLALPSARVVSSGWQMATGGTILMLLAGATGEFHHLPAASAALNARVVASMAYLILAASILAFTAYVWLLEHEPLGRVASYAYVNPVVALALGAWLAGERLTGLQIAGSALVVVGVFATLRGKMAPPARS
jgi:drug/metabolite transporter (DMT)-like permease